MTKKEIGAILKVLRLQSGKTQQQVAEIINRKQQIIGHWETGYSQPDANTLFLLCDIYGVSIDAAFGFSALNSAKLATPEEMHIISKYRKLDERGKKAVCYTLDREYPYIESQQDEYIAERTDYIKKSSTTLDEAEDKIKKEIDDIYYELNGDGKEEMLKHSRYVRTQPEYKKRDNSGKMA